MYSLGSCLTLTTGGEPMPEPNPKFLIGVVVMIVAMAIATEFVPTGRPYVTPHISGRTIILDLNHPPKDATKFTSCKAVVVSSLTDHASPWLNVEIRYDAWTKDHVVTDKKVAIDLPNPEQVTFVTPRAGKFLQCDLSTGSQ